MMSDRGDQKAGGFSGLKETPNRRAPSNNLEHMFKFQEAPPSVGRGGPTVCFLVVAQCGRELLRRFESPLWAFAVNVFVYCLCIQGRSHILPFLRSLFSIPDSCGAASRH